MSNKNEILNYCCYFFKVFKSVYFQIFYNKFVSWQDKLDEVLRDLKVFFFLFENLIFKEDKGIEQLKINSFSFIIYVLISIVYLLCVFIGEMDEWGRGYKEILISG